MPNDNESSEPGDWRDEPVMPIEHLLPPFRRDSPLGKHFAELDGEGQHHPLDGEAPNRNLTWEPTD